MAIKMLTMEHQGYYLEKLLDEFVSKSKEILKENLIGIYLHEKTHFLLDKVEVVENFHMPLQNRAFIC